MAISFSPSVKSFLLEYTALYLKSLKWHPTDNSLQWHIRCNSRTDPDQSAGKVNRSRNPCIPLHIFRTRRKELHQLCIGNKAPPQMFWLLQQ